jgi:hypothetical protein
MRREKRRRDRKKKGFSRFPSFVYTTRVKERRRCDALREGKRFIAAATTERIERQERVIKRHTRRRITVGNFV